MALFSRGPHVGTVEQALVGIEVTNTAEDGVSQQTRRGNGFVLRCDGFVIAPSALFSRTLTVAGEREEAEKQKITVVLAPGTNGERRVSVRRLREVGRDVGYVAVKLDGIHTPALRTLLPDALHGGDPVMVVWSAWDPTERRFLPLLRRAARLAPASPNEGREAASEGYRIAFSEPLVGPPAGAVVIGPDGLAVGLVPGSDTAAKCEEFVSFAALNRATNCVTPVPTPDSTFQTGEKGAQAADATPMVAVPGGPVRLSPTVLFEQQDMEGAEVACVAPFQIDKYEVTNAQYYAFWQSLSDQERRRLGPRYYPKTWAERGAPFPANLANLPVLGVPLPGALAYAKWLGKRLPTPYEWCLAALGAEGDREMPEWARRYVAERRMAWFKVRDLHIQYLQEHPELEQRGVLTAIKFWLPWIVRTPLFINISAWSKRTIETVTGPLWTAWRDPPYVLPVGSRDFDTSPFGAMDMIMNASEMVMPSPGPPASGGPRYMEIIWLPLARPRNDPWAPRGVEMLVDTRELQPLSRLFRRALIGPTMEDVMMWSSLNEALSMLVPLAGWRLRMGGELIATATTWPAGRNPYTVFGLPAGFELWKGMPRLFREEMGRPIPFNETDQHLSTGPQLYYYLPVGFRCAR